MRAVPVSVFLSFLPLVLSHGLITSPTSRQAGPAMAAVCGQQVENNQASDDAGNVQGELQVASNQKDYNPAACNLFLCKGFQFDDNKSNVQSFALGQTIPITVAIRAPHTGTCNVSVVDTKTNQIIGSPLIMFDDYASNSHPIPANNTQFSITLPTDMGGNCQQAGQCVVQWWWNAADIKQTYESCIDFAVGGGGSAPAPPQANSSSAAPPTARSSAPSAPGPDDCDYSLPPSLNKRVVRWAA